MFSNQFDNVQHALADRRESAPIVVAIGGSRGRWYACKRVSRGSYLFDIVQISADKLENIVDELHVLFNAQQTTKVIVFLSG